MMTGIVINANHRTKKTKKPRKISLESATLPSTAMLISLSQLSGCFWDVHNHPWQSSSRWWLCTKTLPTVGGSLVTSLPQPASNTTTEFLIWLSASVIPSLLVHLRWGEASLMIAGTSAVDLLNLFSGKTTGKTNREFGLFRIICCSFLSSQDRFCKRCPKMSGRVEQHFFFHLIKDGEKAFSQQSTTLSAIIGIEPSRNTPRPNLL